MEKKIWKSFTLSIFICKHLFFLFVMFLNESQNDKIDNDKFWDLAAFVLELLKC